jgi:enoyl-[acyl-carrier-protein] reductase (NADH)
MHAALDAAKKYLADSDVFQDCLTNEISATDIQQDAAKEKVLQKELDKRTLANQARKESVGAAINAAIADYKSAHH